MKTETLRLADAIRAHQQKPGRSMTAPCDIFTISQIGTLADFCAKNDPHFDRTVWFQRLTKPQ